MQRISEETRSEIIRLRLSGLSIPEICSTSGIAKTTVQRYVKDVVIPEEFRKRLREKQGGAKARAQGLRENVLEHASELLGELSWRDYCILLIGLYWGEGTKKDFSIINSDPRLLQAFMHALRHFGISKERIYLSLRVHSDISIRDAKTFWSATLGVSEDRIGRVEIIHGKKKGKLLHGMCRVRICSGIKDRLLIQSAIQLIGKEASEKVLSP